MKYLNVVDGKLVESDSYIERTTGYAYMATNNNIIIMNSPILICEDDEDKVEYDSTIYNRSDIKVAETKNDLLEVVLNHPRSKEMSELANNVKVDRKIAKLPDPMTIDTPEFTKVVLMTIKLYGIDIPLTKAQKAKKVTLCRNVTLNCLKGKDITLAQAYDLFKYSGIDIMKMYNPDVVARLKK